MKVKIGLEDYEGTVVVKLARKTGGEEEIQTTLNPLFVLQLVAECEAAHSRVLSNK